MALRPMRAHRITGGAGLRAKREAADSRDGASQRDSGNGFSGVSMKDDDEHFGYKLYAGYEFNRYFALEGGYFDPGRFGYRATTVPAGTLAGNMRLNGVSLDALVFLPMTERFSAFARLGANHAKARDSFVGSGAANALTPDAILKAIRIQIWTRSAVGSPVLCHATRRPSAEHQGPDRAARRHRWFSIGALTDWAAAGGRCSARTATTAVMSRAPPHSVVAAAT